MWPFRDHDNKVEEKSEDIFDSKHFHNAEEFKKWLNEDYISDDSKVDISYGVPSLFIIPDGVSPGLTVVYMKQ